MHKDLHRAVETAINPSNRSVDPDDLVELIQTLLNRHATGFASVIHDLVRRGLRDRPGFSAAQRATLRELGMRHHPTATWLRHL